MRTKESLDAHAAQPASSRDDAQYLTFRLGDEEYGVEIEKVQEIKGYSAITPIPNVPAHVGGVMDLRGTIIPVTNLRPRLGMAETACTPFTVIVVVTVGRRTMGLIVDAVSEVLTVPSAEIQAAPDFGVEVDARFIRGVTKAGDRVVVVLDIERILAGQDGVPV
jgi:purine-binding chemotaxis protein CheW